MKLKIKKWAGFICMVSCMVGSYITTAAATNNDKWVNDLQTKKDQIVAKQQDAETAYTNSKNAYYCDEKLKYVNEAKSAAADAEELKQEFDQMIQTGPADAE